jgi:hypothetical protein
MGLETVKTSSVLATAGQFGARVARFLLVQYTKKEEKCT